MSRRFYDVDEAQTVHITSAREDLEVVLWEKDAAHPNGELFVGGEIVARAALTPKVVEKLNAKQLRVLTAEEAEAHEREREARQAHARTHAAAELRKQRRMIYTNAFGSDRGFDEHFPPPEAA